MSRYFSPVFFFNQQPEMMYVSPCLVHVRSQRLITIVGYQLLTTNHLSSAYNLDSWKLIVPVILIFCREKKSSIFHSSSDVHALQNGKLSRRLLKLKNKSLVFSEQLQALPWSRSAPILHAENKLQKFIANILCSDATNVARIVWKCQNLRYRLRLATFKWGKVLIIWLTSNVGTK